MQHMFKWLFIESHAKWLFIILAIEFFVAQNISPTILTDLPILGKLVESLSFIPMIHNVEQNLPTMEAIKFFIVLTLFFLPIKVFSFYNFLIKNPITELRQYVITPLTTTKPKSSNILKESMMTKVQIAQQAIVNRSLFSRLFFSIMTLLLTLLFTVVLLYGVTDKPFQRTGGLLTTGGSLWWEFSINSTICAVFLAISSLVIQDYIAWFILLYHRFMKFFTPSH